MSEFSASLIVLLFVIIWFCWMLSAHQKRLIQAVLTELRKSDPRAKAPERWTNHDLRRTARSLMSRAGVQPNHAE